MYEDNKDIRLFSIFIIFMYKDIRLFSIKDWKIIINFFFFFFILIFGLLYDDFVIFYI